MIALCRRVARCLPTLVLVALAGCDEASSSAPAVQAPASAAAAPAPTPATPPAPEPPRPPDIIVDRSTVSVGREKLPAGEPGFASALVALLSSQPAIAGQTVDVVAMRNAKPSQVEGVIAALAGAKATAAAVKTETRDGATARLPITFTKSVQDCVTVGWIAKDAAIEVWAAGGGKAKRVIRGLAGPDMTLGIEAMRSQAEGCSASEVAVGAEESMNWGLLFDLGTSALAAPGARASAAVLVGAAVPGRKLAL
jgi:hypothetical protein